MKPMMNRCATRMMRAVKHCPAAGAAAYVLFFSAGCQSSLKVKVELMVPRDGVAAPAVALSEPVRLARVQERVGRGRAAVGAAVSSIETGVAETKKALANLGYGNAAIEGGQFPSLAMLSSACSSAGENLKTSSGEASDVSVLAIKELETRFRTEVARGLEGFNRLRQGLSRRTVPKDDADYDAKLKTTLAALDSLEETAADSVIEVATAGFGGFEVLGVYELNQADPEYRKVLDRTKYQSVGLFSMAEANVNGDSTIVIVQENPGQFRVFEIDNDPTKLIQNVAYISNKALEAAVKYAAP